MKTAEKPQPLKASKQAAEVCTKASTLVPVALSQWQQWQLDFNL